jgi:hypothetical protein
MGSNSFKEALASKKVGAGGISRKFNFLCLFEGIKKQVNIISDLCYHNLNNNVGFRININIM